MAKKRSAGRSQNSDIQFGLNKIQLFLLSCGALLVCGLCFSLGLMLGYQISGVSLKKQLPSKEQIASFIEQGQESSFYDTLPDAPIKSIKPKPIAKAKTKTTKQKTKPSAEKTKNYSIQVAAFKNKKAAYGLRDELKDKGYPAYVSENSQGNTLWYRVRLGEYTSREKAQQVTEQLKKTTKLKPFISP